VKRAFASLDPQEALHVAIFIEERNAEIYRRFADMFAEFRDSESLEIASVFWEMAGEEKQHSSLLQSKYTARYGTSSCAVTEDDIADFIEVPRLEEVDIFAVTDEGKGMSPRDRALQVALNAELSAQRYYATLAQSTHETSLRQLYQELAHLEQEHTDFLERKLASRTAN
jgi:rubrerythrin